MQVMPFWTAEAGRPRDNLFSLRTNLIYGCWILRHYLDRENGDYFRALGRYNGSLGRPEYPNLVLAAWKGRLESTTVPMRNAEGPPLDRRPARAQPAPRQPALRLHAAERGVVVLGHRRVYIVPARLGWLFALTLLVLLLGSINYALSLGFALTFLLAGLGLVGMVHTARTSRASP